MEQTFKTALKNERAKEAVVLYERNGGTIGLLMPGEEWTVETWNPETIYSRWTEVYFREAGEVRLVENPDWPKPEGRWILEVVNVEGRSCETRIISGREVVLPKGIPRLCAVELDDPMAGYCRLEIRKVLERSEHPLYPGYSLKREVIRDIYIDRPESELEAQRIELERVVNEIEHV